MMRGMLSAMGLAAMLGAASASASPTQSAGQVVGHMQELNLEQVRDSPHLMHLATLRADGRVLGDRCSWRRCTLCWTTMAPAASPCTR